jgi:hypothetical protein
MRLLVIIPSLPNRRVFKYQNKNRDTLIRNTSCCLFLRLTTMATAKKTTCETNVIYNDSESDSELDSEVSNESGCTEDGDSEPDSELDSEVTDESGSTEDRHSDIENEMEVSGDENDSSRNHSNCTPRLWQKRIFKPKLFNFQSNHCGITTNLDDHSPLDLFKLFFDQKLVQFIVDETNNFQANSSNESLSTSSHQAKWSRTNPEEIYLFLATFMLMAHVKKYKIKDYWSTDRLIATPVFGDIIPRDRFLLLLKFLHFNDNKNQSETDKLFKISPVVKHLKQKFQRIMIPHRNLCIDESLTLWKGRLSFKQYIPSKRHRYGIKIFILCDCLTGFVLDFEIYVGSQTYIERYEDLGVAGSVVMMLMRPYLQKGHNLFMDNWYTSPALFEVLHENLTGACGTVRKNRTGMPNFIDELTRGEIEYQHTDVLLALKWFDKREVTMLSTIHEPKMVYTGKTHYETNEPIQKPASVQEYNQNRGIVDKFDMQISAVECVRKTIKWYKKLFFHLLDVTVLNSYILHKQKSRENIQFSDFRLQLIRQIIETYGCPKAPRGRPNTGDNPIRLIGRHFPSLIPSTSTSQSPQKRCVVCTNTTNRATKSTKTRYECRDCNVGLCISACFRDYHTLKYF